MQNFVDNVLSGIGITDIIDIIIVSFVIYKVLSFIRESRAEQLVKGLLFLLLATVLSEVCMLYTLNWLLRGTMTVGMIAIVIVFQPELRRALEYMGRSKIMSGAFGKMDKDKAKKITTEFVKAIESFSNSKTGALIIIEQETTLTDIVETGTTIDAAIKEELLGNIFYEGAPLHDGAIVVRGDRIVAAGCVLPLTQNKTLSKDLGTRHRAGIGITENSDALAIIVSEETGIISMAIDGRLTRFLDVKAVEKTLLNTYLSGSADESKKGIIPNLTDLFSKIGKGKEDAEK